jgi:hypothetical protein
MTPTDIADRILNAAGSGLRHYTPQSRAAIEAAAAEALRDYRRAIADQVRDQMAEWPQGYSRRKLTELVAEQIEAGPAE